MDNLHILYERLVTIDESDEDAVFSQYFICNDILT